VVEQNVANVLVPLYYLSNFHIVQFSAIESSSLFGSL